MPQVVIYLSAGCSYCTRATKLLRRKGVEFTEIRVDQDYEERERMYLRSNRFTVPQIFIEDHHVGGFDDLSALDAAGELDPLLGL